MAHLSFYLDLPFPKQQKKKKKKKKTVKNWTPSEKSAWSLIGTLWVAKGPTFLQAKNYMYDSDQIVQMCSLILIFTMRTCQLVLYGLSMNDSIKKLSK